MGAFPLACSKMDQYLVRHHLLMMSKQLFDLILVGTEKATQVNVQDIKGLREGTVFVIRRIRRIRRIRSIMIHHISQRPHKPMGTHGVHALHDLGVGVGDMNPVHISSVLFPSGGGDGFFGDGRAWKVVKG
jgi:hypothetical protein